MIARKWMKGGVPAGKMGLACNYIELVSYQSIVFVIFTPFQCESDEDEGYLYKRTNNIEFICDQQALTIKTISLYI